MSGKSCQNLGTNLNTTTNQIYILLALRQSLIITLALSVLGYLPHVNYTWPLILVLSHLEAVILESLVHPTLEKML